MDRNEDGDGASCLQNQSRPEPEEKIFYEGMELPEGKDMSRGMQTAWIVGVIIALALGFLYYDTRVDQDLWYAKCQTLLGEIDQKCAADYRNELLGN